MGGIPPDAFKVSVNYPLDECLRAPWTGKDTFLADNNIQPLVHTHGGGSEKEEVKRATVFHAPIDIHKSGNMVGRPTLTHFGRWF